MIDLHNRRFGKLTVIKVHSKPASGGVQWLCTCDCGGTKITAGTALTKGRTTRCAKCCAEAVSKRFITHGHTIGADFSPTYVSWYCMLTRVRNGNIKQAKDYSKRGITVDPRWLSYEAFLVDMGERPEGTTLDRINNDGSYGPDNCRWADRATQNSNKRQRGKICA